MSFKEAVHLVSAKTMIRLVFPRWMLGLTPSLRKIRDAFDEFDVRFFSPLHSATAYALHLAIHVRDDCGATVRRSEGRAR